MHMPTIDPSSARYKYIIIYMFGGKVSDDNNNNNNNKMNNNNKNNKLRLSHIELGCIAEITTSLVRGQSCHFSLCTTNHVELLF